jgi:hypothetical protein
MRRAYGTWRGRGQNESRASTVEVQRLGFSLQRSSGTRVSSDVKLRTGKIFTILVKRKSTGSRVAGLNRVQGHKDGRGRTDGRRIRRMTRGGCVGGRKWERGGQRRRVR